MSQIRVLTRSMSCLMCWFFAFNFWKEKKRLVNKLKLGKWDTGSWNNHIQSNLNQREYQPHSQGLFGWERGWENICWEVTLPQAQLWDFCIRKTLQENCLSSESPLKCYRQLPISQLVTLCYNISCVIIWKEVLIICGVCFVILLLRFERF